MNNFRVFEQPNHKLPFNFHSSKEVYEEMKDYQKADREMFLLLFLDCKNKVIEIEPHSIGCVDASAVYPREVLRSALLKNASAIIAVHNHPSGDPEPSECDKNITRHLVICAELFQIRFLDSIIIGAGKYFSFADQGLIEEYLMKAQDVIKGG